MISDFKSSYLRYKLTNLHKVLENRSYQVAKWYLIYTVLIKLACFGEKIEEWLDRLKHFLIKLLQLSCVWFFENNPLKY